MHGTTAPDHHLFFPIAAPDCPSSNRHPKQHGAIAAKTPKQSGKYCPAEKDHTQTKDQ
jgi:hypothetical protein